MGKPIILSSRTYDELKTIKKGISTNASFETAVKMLIYEMMGKGFTRKNILYEIKHKMLRVKIYYFLRDLQDQELVAEHIDLENVSTVIQLLCANKWKKVLDIVKSKNDYLDDLIGKVEDERVKLGLDLQMKGSSHS